MVEVDEHAFTDFLDAQTEPYDCVRIDGIPPRNQYLVAGDVIAESCQGDGADVPRSFQIAA